MLNATHALKMNRWWGFSFQLKLASNLFLAWVMFFLPPFEFWFNFSVHNTFGPDYENNRFFMLKPEKENTVSFYDYTHTLFKWLTSSPKCIHVTVKPLFPLIFHFSRTWQWIIKCCSGLEFVMQGYSLGVSWFFFFLILKSVQQFWRSNKEKLQKPKVSKLA